jgi:hypothetical protein
VVDALNMRNGPKTTAIYSLPLNLPVLVWREGPIGQLSYWSSLYNLLSIKNKTYTIQLPYRPTNFYSTAIKLYLVDPKIIEDTQLEDNENELPLP